MSDGRRAGACTAAAGLLAVALVAGCHDGRRNHGAEPPAPRDAAAATADATHDMGGAMPTPMRPTAPTSFEAGPRPIPADALLTWLEGTAAGDRPRRVKLPVVLRFEDRYRLAYREVFVGADAAASAEGAIRLDLDDTPLGNPLLDTVAGLCPDDRDACAVWLEGTWGALVDLDIGLDDDDDGPRRWPFTVLAVHERIDDPAAVETVFGEPPRP